MLNISGGVPPVIVSGMLNISGGVPPVIARMLENLKDKKILILGFGREGRDTFLFLRKLFPAKVLGIGDEKKFLISNFQFSKLLKNDKRIIFHLGEDYLKAVGDYDVIIKSPGIPIHLPEIEKAFKEGKITSQTEIFLENCPARIIGITGSKGKGTTASLIYQILKKSGLGARLVGNIGRPVLQYLFSAKKKDIFVYEISSHQLYRLKKSPSVAVFLNIYPAHLDYFRNFNEYIAAKANITKFQTKKDILIYNSENEFVKKIAEKSLAKKIPISKNYRFLGNLQKKNKLPLLGKFNLQNIMAAVAVGKIFKISDSDILDAIKKFKPLPHRLEFVGVCRGIKFYNDSLATIPAATLRALEALGRDVQTLICGGFEAGVDYRDLAKKILKNKIRTLILFPASGKKISKEIKDLSDSRRVPKEHFVDNMRDAVKLAFRSTAKGKICLLSCASPSFGIFKDYKQRGDLFKKYVKRFRAH